MWEGEKVGNKGGDGKGGPRYIFFLKTCLLY